MDIECSTLDDLNQKFVQLTSSLKQKLMLRDGLAAGEERCNNILIAVESGMSDLQVQLALMRSEINRRKRAINELEVLKTEVSGLNERIQHANDNLPQRLPQAPQHLANQQRPAPSLQTQIPVTPTHKKKLQSILTPLSSCSSVSSTVSPTAAPSVGQIKKKAPTLFVPTVDYVTVQEFELVPKYMKGRITYEQINSAIDEFNKAVTGKYRLMGLPRKKQNDRIKNAIWDYKQQETKDTKGIWFIVDADLKQYSSLKMDSVGRALFTILRHCNKIREIRTKGLNRYAVIAL